MSFIKLLSFVVLLLSLAARGALASTSRVLIKNVIVVDVNRSKLLPSQDILVEGEKIISIRPHSHWKSSGEAQIIDGKGMYVTPGLIDMHVHMDLWHYGERADDWALPLFIANGITTIRDAGGSPLTLEMRKQVAAGARLGPRMVIATPFLTSEDSQPGSNTFTVKSPEEVPSKIGSFFREGYDFVKTDFSVIPSVLDASAGYAKKHHRYLMGHPLIVKDQAGHPHVDYPRIFRNYQTVEHTRWFLGDYLQSTTSPHYNTSSFGALLWSSLAYMDSSKIAPLVRELRKSGLPLTPTLTPVDITGNFTATAEYVKSLGFEGFRKHPRFRYLPDYVYQDWLDIIEAWGTQPEGEPELRKAYANEGKVLRAIDEAYLPLLVGTDVPARPTMVHGFSLHEEMKRLQDAGVSTWGILRGSTSHAARALNLGHELGTIAPRMSADFVLTKENPVADIRALATPQIVFSHGHAYDRKTLDAVLAKTEQTVRAIPLLRLKLNPEALACGSVKDPK